MVKDLLLRIIQKGNFSWGKSACALMIFCSSPWVVAAPTVTAVVPLDFGVLAVKSNAGVSTLRISSAGAQTYTGDVIPIGGAIRGQYRLSGFPAGVLLEVQLDNATLSTGGGGLPEYLQVTSYENPTLVSDGAGEALVPLGATLETSGSGIMYADAPYSGTTQLRVRYWSPLAGGYLTHFDTATFNAQLQTAFSITETQPLSFGLVAAFTDSGLAASMTLDVNGNVGSVTNAGSARLAPLGGAQIGLIRVTGAAANYAVTITPEAGSIFLTHVTQGTAVARFVVKNFITTPSSPGARTDSVGELQIRVGATLETEITSKAYAGGTYSGTYNLTVTY